MIGGDDIVLKAGALDPEELMSAGIRTVLREWNEAVLQDANSGQRVLGLWELPLARAREVMLYKDDDSFHVWMRDGATPANQHSMVHLIADRGELTVVVGDRCEGATARLLNHIRGALDSILIMREAA